jgi:LPLT family lysophospholipid transporter-like MFS transporter
MLAVLTAQFLSAFGDNVLLVAAIALVKTQGHAGWIPLLQVAFVAPFILLAPFVGAVADAFPKGRVMFLANGLKLAAALFMALGANPLLCYGLAGVGAAAYSPAKYGILSQLFAASKLVRANGLLEGSTIVAILLGVLAGGWLADQGVGAAFAGVTAVYALAAVGNLLIPRLAPEHRWTAFRPWALIREFLADLTALWRDRDARFSLLGTSVFWGTGSTLRLLLFAWVPVALGVAGNQMPANLMGAVSIGIVVGAVLAGALVRLEQVDRALLGGLLLGPLVLLFAPQTALIPAALVLVAIGAAGGFFVVPLNALLQERGHHSVGAGRALAVQNLWENLAMFSFVGLYAGLEGLPPAVTAYGYGAAVLAGITALALGRWGRRRRG